MRFGLVLMLTIGAWWGLAQSAFAAGAGGQQCAAEVQWTNSKVNCTSDPCGPGDPPGGTCKNRTIQHQNVTPWTYTPPVPPATEGTWTAGTLLTDQTVETCDCKIGNNWGEGIYGSGCCDVGLSGGHLVTVGECTQCPQPDGTCKPKGTTVSARAICD